MEEKTTKCDCGRFNSRTAKFCSNCGEVIVQKFIVDEKAVLRTKEELASEIDSINQVLFKLKKESLAPGASPNTILIIQTIAVASALKACISWTLGNKGEENPPPHKFVEDIAKIAGGSISLDEAIRKLEDGESL